MSDTDRLRALLDPAGRSQRSLLELAEALMTDLAAAHIEIERLEHLLDERAGRRHRRVRKEARA